MPHNRRMLMCAVAAAVAAAGFVVPSGATAAAPRTVASDFNGDGYADVAVGVPDGTVGGQAKAGYVNVVWGGPKGAGAHGSIRITQATPELPGTPEAGDRFGASVALVDLNGDGIAELLAGVPGEDVTDRGTDAGMVTAVGGSKGGPGPGSTVLTGPSPSAAYGRSVAAADLTGGGNKAIVIGGKDKVVARVIQGEDSMVTTVVAAPMGGRAPVLATGDFDSDGTADLAVAYWTESDPNTQSHVRLWKWDADRSAMANFWNTDNAGVTALAAGDFDGDGHDDLALGECREIADENIDDPCGPEELAKGGGVHIHYGSPAGGPFGSRAQTLNQDTAGVPGVAEDGDRFGAALAAADVDRDGRDDLIAGALGEAIGSRTGAGAAWLLHGGAKGLLDAAGAATSVAWNQDTSGVPGVAEAGDTFGAAVASGDFNADGIPDVTAGSPGENASLGAVWYLPGGSARGSAAFSPRTLGLPYPSTAQKYGKPLSTR
ncbi:FG-GAP and VCBS repeat-containing protein [Streptomyces marispadix]|uniref:VCBS repeat-containing protein n=1 Tax=Streptomyces marispadix TaxID=2922868 RepID=A0ABS9T3V0_9ACTN|nr:FG-GAP and VCBS repeat-containing protein [Streptomyces marispadix]MCH6163218.1 VCBS repeat-containing protein [Streptomyces marispadix]